MIYWSSFYNNLSDSELVVETHSRSTKNDKNITVELDLPGVKKTDVHVSVAGQLVKIEATRRQQKFTRTVELSKAYDPDTLSACLEDGVLTLTAKRRESITTREIIVS
jgi:HSP20 family protein